MNALFEYRNSLDNLRFSPEQKAALAERAAESAGGKTRRHPLWRTALIAACLTAALAVGAGASGVLKSAVEVFAPIFGGSAAQTEVIDKDRPSHRCRRHGQRRHHHRRRHHRRCV